MRTVVIISSPSVEGGSDVVAIATGLLRGRFCRWAEQGSDVTMDLKLEGAVISHRTRPVQSRVHVCPRFVLVRGRRRWGPKPNVAMAALDRVAPWRWQCLPDARSHPTSGVLNTEVTYCGRS